MRTVTKYIKETIAAHPDADPHEIASETAATVPTEELRACLSEALVDLARITLGAHRRGAMDNAVGPARSPKVEERASWWAKMLAERVYVGDEWKTLGQCTYDDLGEVIGARKELIARISGQIENFERLQQLMIHHEVERVSDIPPQSEWVDAA